jgi:hypothetical protein
MRGVGWIAAVSILLAAVPLVGEQQNGASQTNPSYLTWTLGQAQQIGRSTRVNGRVGGVLDFRVAHTEHSYNYKLRATWLTSEVIRATARLAQLSDGLSNEQTEAIVREAEAAGETVVMVEIDPNEGSGVIPLDWVAFLGPRGSPSGEPGVVKGTSLSRLRSVRALSGVFRRDYNYEVFWVVFPLSSEAGKPLFPESAREAELVVRIYNKEGRVKWLVPDSIRRKQEAG